MTFKLSEINHIAALASATQTAPVLWTWTGSQAWMPAFDRSATLAICGLYLSDNAASKVKPNPATQGHKIWHVSQAQLFETPMLSDVVFRVAYTTKFEDTAIAKRLQEIVYQQLYASPIINFSLKAWRDAQWIKTSEMCGMRMAIAAMDHALPLMRLLLIAAEPDLLNPKFNAFPRLAKDVICQSWEFQDRSNHPFRAQLDEHENLNARIIRALEVLEGLHFLIDERGVPDSELEDTAVMLVDSMQFLPDGDGLNQLYQVMQTRIDDSVRFSHIEEEDYLDAMRTWWKSLAE
ncbi:MAG: hypothetical protein HWE20_01025 [Gammaproteobacteria bacterium]|nr:hypothetical protein [Gammaproteobacteria bacterium]